MKINEILAENITKDYFNAKVKTEVIFDTILTPVIFTATPPRSDIVVGGS